MTTNTLHQRLAQMITGYWTSQAIYAAAKFGIADLLQSGPRSVDDLAVATSTHADALYRLLRALASLGIFTEGERREFWLTPLAELLCSNVDGSQRALALMAGDEQFHAWGEIAHSIQTGETAFEKYYGQPLFEYLAQHPEKARVFDAAMTAIHGRESAAMLAAYDFTGVGVLADIGGGNGSTITSILQQHPGMHGILFDLPHVAERARQRLEEAGLLSRCEVVGGNFFEAVPPGADVHLLRHIVHDWDDERAALLLKNCHAALPGEGKLLVVESVIPPGNEPFGGKLLDLTMLLIPGGKERTAAEYAALYEEAGFELTRIVPTAMEVSIIEGIRR